MKNYLISISIVIGCITIGGYIYDTHKFDELLRVKDMQKSQLLLNTMNLELHLSLKESLKKGDIQEVSKTMDLLIDGMSKQIKSDLSDVELSPEQQKRVSNAINGVIEPCEDEI
ncbi:hypothetical protein [Shewanella waksmanii]|uniref:hypothetical protein n=1 Tax=Shewanella waksmanii TaxID=213783 RepID=UPI0037366A59